MFSECALADTHPSWNPAVNDGEEVEVCNKREL